MPVTRVYVDQTCHDFAKSHNVAMELISVMYVVVELSRSGVG